MYIKAVSRLSIWNFPWLNALPLNSLEELYFQLIFKLQDFRQVLDILASKVGGRSWLWIQWNFCQLAFCGPMSVNWFILPEPLCCLLINCFRMSRILGVASDLFILRWHFGFQNTVINLMQNPLSSMCLWHSLLFLPPCYLPWHIKMISLCILSLDLELLEDRYHVLVLSVFLASALLAH